MPKRKRDEDNAPKQPLRQRTKRSPQDVYDYWTDEKMADARPLELERRRPAKDEREIDDGERSGG
jgi:hypothetical protein